MFFIFAEKSTQDILDEHDTELCCLETNYVHDISEDCTDMSNEWKTKEFLKLIINFFDVAFNDN